MKSFDKKAVLNVLYGSILGIFLAGLLYLFLHQPSHYGMILLPTRVANSVTVYLTGEIVNPGVFTLPAGARLADAIEKAGGFTPVADQQGVNLAALLEDEDRIVVPGKNMSTPSSPNVKSSKLVNINTATSHELEDLTAIGAVKAQAIIDYRNQKGPFLSIEDIMNVPGIGEDVFDQFKDQISVNP